MTRGRVHTRKHWPSTIPRPISIGAGDNPPTLKGASGSATRMPQLRRLLKPRVSETTALAAEHTADGVDLDVPVRRVGTKPKAEHEHHGRDDDHQ